jgi:hypothetical protein
VGARRRTKEVRCPTAHGGGGAPGGGWSTGNASKGEHEPVAVEREGARRAAQRNSRDLGKEVEEIRWGGSWYTRPALEADDPSVVPPGEGQRFP